MSIIANRWRARLTLAIPFLLPFVLLWPFRAAGLVADDFYFARTTFSLQAGDLAANREWRHDIAPNVRGYRPLSTASYALSHRLADGTPSSYRLMNFGLHGVASSLVAALAATLAGSTGVGLAAGALFAVHPVHHENVVWISGRTFPLAAIFYLAALWLTARAYRRDMDGTSSSTSPGTTMQAVAAIGLCLGALTSYEAAVTLPLAVFALAFSLTRHDGGHEEAAARRGASWTMRAGRAARSALPYAIVTAIYLLLRWLLVSSVSSEASAYGGQRVARNAMAVAARLLAMPRLGHTPIPSVTFGISALVATLAIGAGLIGRSTRRIVAWALVFAGLAYLPFIAWPGYSDRFTYLTSAGLVVAIAASVRPWLHGGAARRAVAAAVLCLVAGLWSVQLVRAGEQWAQAGEIASQFAAQLQWTLPDPPRGARLGFLCVPDFYGTAYVYYTYFEMEMQRTLQRRDVAIVRFPRAEEGLAAVDSAQRAMYTREVDYLFRWLDRERRLELVAAPQRSFSDANALACQPAPTIVKP